MTIATLIIRILLSCVLLISGLGKVRRSADTREAANQLGLPSRMTPAVGFVLPYLEIILAVSLLIPLTGLVASESAAVLMAAFTIVVGYNNVAWS